MLCGLAAAPWCLAGAPLGYQPWLFGIALLATVAGIFADLQGPNFRTLHWPVLAFPLLGVALVAWAGFQLLPLSSPLNLPHSVLGPELNVFNGGSGPKVALSIYPAETRLAMSRIILAIAAFLGGAWLFSAGRQRRLLWMVLTVNGAGLAIFGLIQKATWNDRVYWTIPLRFGGQPFASFINRNNAAGYFAICLAVALGLLLRDRTSSPEKSPGWNLDGDSNGERGNANSPWSMQLTFAAIVILCTGILATLSRGGILSTATAFLMTLVWLGGFRKWRYLVLPLGATLIAAFGLIGWIGFGGQLHYRLASLQQPLANEGRVLHWTDMIAAIRDFPITGMGLGSYRYANKPYQNHFSYGWYVNADNQYLEWLVEAGFPALAIALLGLALVAYLARFWQRRGMLPEALVCGWLAVTQGIQSMGDFGVIVTANMMTLAVVLGSLSTSDIRDRIVPLAASERLQRVLDQRTNQRYSLWTAILVIIIAGAGLAELSTAAASWHFRDRIPTALTKRGQLTLQETDQLLQQGNSIVGWRPDDAELHATIAQLWLYRYRLEVFEAIATESASDSELDKLWERTALDSFFSEVIRLHVIGASDSMEELSHEPRVNLNLQSANRHAVLAKRACPLIPKLGFLQSAIGILNGGNGIRALRTEAAISPSDPDRLSSIGLYADRLGDRELFMNCLQRELQFRSDRVEQVLTLATKRLELDEIISQVLPQNPETLVTAAETWKSAKGRDAAMSRAVTSVEVSRLAPGQKSILLARLAILNQRPDDADTYFLQAIREVPFQASLRLRYAEFLQSQGNTAGALHQVEIGRAVAGDDETAAKQLDELLLRLSHQRGR